MICAAVLRAAGELTSGPYSGGQVSKYGNGRIPVDAGVGDANALLEPRRAFRRYFLVALVDVGLDHDTDDGRLAFAELIGNHLCDLGLVSVVLVRVAYLALVNDASSSGD